MVYLIHLNPDHNETTLARHTRAEAVADIAEAFQVIAEPDSPDFWEEVSAAYERQGWKGFTFQELDPATLKITPLH